MNTYRIRTGTGEHTNIREVKGYQVIFPSFEEFSFFVHEALTSGYNVTEASTGYLLGEGYYPTEIQAIEAAQVWLNNQGIDTIRKVVSEFIERCGALQQPTPVPTHECPDCGDTHAIKSYREVEA